MKRDEKGLKLAIESRYKYVLAKNDGTIVGWGLTRETLKKGMEKRRADYLLTIRQYIKITEQ